MSGAFVKNVGTATAGNATTNAITVPAGGVAAGNVVILHSDRGSSGVTISVADSKGNTYTVLATQNAGQPSTSVAIGIITNALVSGDTITTTFSSKGTNGSTANEYSGITNTSDGTNTNATGVSTTPSISITPSNATDLIVAQVDVNSGSADTYTEDSDSTGGDTWHSLTTLTDGSNHKLHPAYKITTSAAAQTYNPTLGTSRTWNTVIAAKQDDTAGGGPPPWFPKAVIF